MCELARAHLEAVTLCAGLQRHFGRRSTSASRSEPREPLSWYRGREAVRHQAFELQLDLMTLENRPDQHAACWDRAEFAELPDREPLRERALAWVRVYRPVDVFRDQKLDSRQRCQHAADVGRALPNADGRFTITALAC